MLLIVSKVNFFYGLAIYLLIAIVVWYILYIRLLSKYKKENIKIPFNEWFGCCYDVETIIMAVFWIFILMFYIIFFPFILINHIIKRHYNVK